MMKPFLNRSQSGFTLIEAVMVIVITGILGALASSFVTPLQGYFDAILRADLTDVADTALRRMARDVNLALPNSIRVDATGKYLELLPTTTGGRYRARPNSDSGGAIKCGGTLDQDKLDFTTTDTCFEVIGPLRAAPAEGEELVVSNTAPADAYSGNNVATIAAGSTTSKIIFASKQFPAESEMQRFQIIGRPVTYVCDSASSTLWRYTGYARQAAQPASIATLNGLANVTRARLATAVNCAGSGFVYQNQSLQGLDFVVMRLTLLNARDSIALLHQVHVQNDKP